MNRAWSLLTIDESERQFAGNLGYTDVLGSKYAWDSTVPNHRAVQPGDLAVLRNGSHVLGVGWIDDVQTETATKVRRRCPRCGNTAFKTRKQLTPRYKCSPCQNLFDEPAQEQINVTVHVCDYARTWRPTADLRATDVASAYLNRSAQQSIRPLHPELITQLLGQAYDPGLRWWVEATDPRLPGGHRSRLGQVRIGQAQFRQVLRQRFGDRCLITGPQPPQAIEAAHLYRYCDTPKHDIAGGVLLRRDLHSLFDCLLLAIDPSNWVVRLSPSLDPFPDLVQLGGRKLAIPPQVRPREEYLLAHLRWATDLWNQQGTSF
ncbi:HNH endonuclease [Micromonospora trifolii]|uniref:HNH endonuclease n=1 Tax=Micromonospora trifolii TaxID=2911208 RepID=UPI003D2F30A2